MPSSRAATIIGCPHEAKQAECQPLALAWQSSHRQNSMKIELGTLLGRPMIFLQGIKVSNEIQNEFAIAGQEGVDDALATAEIAIPVEIAVERILVIENDEAKFEY